MLRFDYCALPEFVHRLPIGEDPTLLWKSRAQSDGDGAHAPTNLGSIASAKQTVPPAMSARTDIGPRIVFRLRLHAPSRRSRHSLWRCSQKTQPHFERKTDMRPRVERIALAHVMINFGGSPLCEPEGIYV